MSRQKKCFQYVGAIAAGLLLMVGTAKAYIIDFEPLPTPVTGSGVLTASDEVFTDGAYAVEAWWYSGIPTTGGAAWNPNSGHFHFGTDNPSPNVELQHFNGNDQLQGFMIRRTDNMQFSVSSLDYRVRSTQSINGFLPSNVQILLDDQSFGASGTVAAEFTQFPVGGVGNVYSTLPVSRFCSTRLFISSSASVGFDNINVDACGTSVPEPESLALVGIALAWLGFSRARRKATTGA